MGTLHGGVLCDIAEAAMGIAYSANLDDEESFTAGTPDQLSQANLESSVARRKAG
jgi:hypothetical protein